MIREIFEETGIRLDTKTLKYFDKVYVRYPEIDFIYHMYSIQVESKPIINIRDTEHSEYQWIRPVDSLKLSLIEDLDECTKLFYQIN